MNYERMAVRFQQRIAEQALRYEGDIAVLTEQLEEANEKIAALEGTDVEAEDAPVATAAKAPKAK